MVDRSLSVYKSDENPLIDLLFMTHYSIQIQIEEFYVDLTKGFSMQNVKVVVTDSQTNVITRSIY